MPIPAIALIISAVASAASAGYGIFSSAQAKRDQEEELARQEAAIRKENERIAKQEAEQKAWYQRERNMPTLEREENRAAMGAAHDAVKEQNRIADSRAAIMGASSEAKAAQRANGLKIISGLARDISAAGTRYKQQLDSSYYGLAAQNNALRAQNAANATSLSNAYINAAGNRAENASQLVANGIAGFGDAAADYFNSVKPIKSGNTGSIGKLGESSLTSFA
jgi:hypothetical protein